jgi:hypothetical protein
MIMCNGYNRAGLTKWHSWETFDSVFAAGYERMKALSGSKPLGVGETSSVPSRDGKSKSQWIRDAFKSVNDKYKRVEEFDW